MKEQQTDRLIFRDITWDDYDEWLAFFSNPETSRHWIAEQKEPGKACKDWYAYQFERYATNRGGMNALVEKESGRLIGHCGLLQQNVDGKEEIEIAYSLLPGFWNKGYATEAALKCRDYAFGNHLATSLISIISVTNIPSEKVAFKVGMKIDKTTVYKSNAVNIFRIDAPSI